MNPGSITDLTFTIEPKGSLITVLPGNWLVANNFHHFQIVSVKMNTTYSFSFPATVLVS